MEKFELVDKDGKNTGKIVTLEELEDVNNILGLSAVHAQGIVIRLSHGEAPENALDLSYYIVHDINLRDILIISSDE